MNFFDQFIDRPVATTLLTAAIALSGALAFNLLPVSPMPQVDFPTIFVQASLPGASPETMASTVATPLERALGRISGITEMTSTSSLGNTNVVLQFDLDRDIDGAARDVQAALNAARTLLPSGMPSNPTYRKVNPADAPIVILAMTSDTVSQGRMYDAASTILAQKLSQLDGVGQVSVGGSALPAIRVDVNPSALNKYGIDIEDVRTSIASSNANRPKGVVEDGARQWQIAANDQSLTADAYPPLIVSYRAGRAVRLSDVATVSESVEDTRNAGIANGKPAVLVIVNRQPNANIIETVDRIKAALPQLRASISSAVDLDVMVDRSITIRNSVHDVELTLLISIALVILVVYVFLRNARATLVPAVAVPVSLIGTFGVMYLAGFSLNNLSLMALTIATGFVVDDAVVVLENTSRHIEAGIAPVAAARRSVREVGFTVLSMSLSLIAVFIPIMFMGGIVGRFFREFAITLSVAILISLVISVTTTPMMCACRLAAVEKSKKGLFARTSEATFNAIHQKYARTLRWALRHAGIVLLVLFTAIAGSIYLFKVIPKGFVPDQDTGRISGNIQGDQAASFQSMQTKLKRFMNIIASDPAIENVVGFTGGGRFGSSSSARMFIALKPLQERRLSSDMVIERLRRRLGDVPGATLFLQAQSDVRAGGRSSNAMYQYTMQSDSLTDLRTWEPRIRAALSHLPELEDVNSDSEDRGLQAKLVIDRDSAARLHIDVAQLDATLNDYFGQRLVSTLYNRLNQYHVVLEAAPEFAEGPASLNDVYVSASNGNTVHLSMVAHYEPAHTSLSVNHQGQFAASTISFNLPPSISLSQASEAIERELARIGAPSSIHGEFAGTAKVFQASLASQPILILAALLTMYIVLGILYESLIHPITILSTLPSAGVGALLALLIFKVQFDIIGLIGLILLIGIVKKNAIMMIDFAIDTERRRHIAPEEAIYEACLLRFRPIMMTTMAAMLGAVPMAIGFGEGAELRRPLGITVVGGLLLSQLLTLYTTPVVYLYLDRFRLWCLGLRANSALEPNCRT